jgi:hypothetical protein
MIVPAAFAFGGPGASAQGRDPGQDRAQDVAALARVGGFVTPGGRFLPEGLVVGIEGGKATDADLVHLRSLKDVSVLVLDSTMIGDAGLVYLKHLKKLKVLSLEDTQVVTLDHVEDLTGLRSLDLKGTEVADAGLAHLRALKDLRELDLTGTRVTDAGLAHLEGLKHLRNLTVAETGVSPDGIKKLRRALPWCRIR